MLRPGAQVKRPAPLLRGHGGAARVRPPFGDPRVITALFALLNAVIGLFIWALIIQAVFSILASFGVLDTRNRLVWTVGDFLYRVTEPVLRPVRNALPAFGSVDLSPLVVILGLQYIARPLLDTLYRGIVTGTWSLV